MLLSTLLWPLIAKAYQNRQQKKLEKLRQEKKVDEFVSHSVNHKDFISWQHQILGYKKSRTKIRKLRRKYRRWDY